MEIDVSQQLNRVLECIDRWSNHYCSHIT